MKYEEGRAALEGVNWQARLNKDIVTLCNTLTNRGICSK